MVVTGFKHQGVPKRILIDIQMRVTGEVKECSSQKALFCNRSISELTGTIWLAEIKLEWGEGARERHRADGLT